MLPNTATSALTQNIVRSKTRLIPQQEELNRFLSIYQQGWSVFPEQSSQKTAAVTSQIETALTSISSKKIIIPQSNKVREYLLRFPDMIHLTPFVCKIVWDRFWSSAQLSVEVYHDPEIEDEHIIIYVRQGNYDADIMDTLQELHSQYEAELTGKSGWLLVTTDFRPPQ